MTWYDRLLRLTANWHWDANAQLLCLGSAEAVSVRGARADPEFWSNMNAVPVLHGL